MEISAHSGRDSIWCFGGACEGDHVRPFLCAGSVSCHLALPSGTQARRSQNQGCCGGFFVLHGTSRDRDLGLDQVCGCREGTKSYWGFSHQQELVGMEFWHVRPATSPSRLSSASGRSG